MSAPSLLDAAAAHRTLAAFYEAQAAAQAPQRADEWIAQRGSVLGNRRHIAAVRRRVAAGLEGARIVGRRYLLTRAAIDAELGSVTATRALVGEPAVDELASLRARLEGRIQ